MRIAYVAGTALPSRVASTVNVLKMCRSLAAAGHEVTLYARGWQADAPAVFDTRGLERRFDLVLRAPPGLRLTKNLFYPAQVAREMARRPPPDLLYGRHAYVLACAASASRGAAPSGYEAHALPKRRARRMAESWLFRRPRFSLLVAISRALAEDYGARFPALAGRECWWRTTGPIQWRGAPARRPPLAGPTRRAAARLCRAPLPGQGDGGRGRPGGAGAPLLRLIGGEAATAAWGAMMLALAASIGFAGFTLEPLLVSVERHGRALRLRFLATLAYIPSAVVGLRFLGPEGAGAAVLSASLLLAGQALAAKRWLRAHHSGPVSPP